MREINVLGYSLKQGVKNLRKNRLFTLASMGTVAACLLIFGLVYFLVGNFRAVIKGAETSVGVSVFFEENSSQSTIDTIGEAIKARPEVDRVEYISAEKAWENFKKDNFKDSQELIDSFGDDNPLKDSASYEVYLKKLSDQDSLVSYIESIAGVREVKRSAEVAGTLSGASKMVGAGSAVLIHSTISTGIVVRKPEIAIMRLMGASDFFIWAPFIIEGVIIGFIGSVIPLVILLCVYGRIIDYVVNRFAVFTANLTFLTTGQAFGVLVPVSLAIGVGIGFLGSFITVRRNLNY